MPLPSDLLRRALQDDSGAIHELGLALDQLARLTQINYSSSSTLSGGAPVSASYLTVNTELGLTAERALTAGALIGLTDGGANSILTIAAHLHHITKIGASTTEYPSDTAGLTAALAAAASGERVIVPPGTFTASYVVPAGVVVVGAGHLLTTITGSVTLGAGAGVGYLAITRTANDAGDLTGLIAPASGTGWAWRVLVSVTQSGAGNAYAAYSAAGGVLRLDVCELLSPAGGAGTHYGTYRDSSGGSIYGDNCIIIGYTGASNE